MKNLMDANVRCLRRRTGTRSRTVIREKQTSAQTARAVPFASGRDPTGHSYSGQNVVLLYSMKRNRWPLI